MGKRCDTLLRHCLFPLRHALKHGAGLRDLPNVGKVIGGEEPAERRLVRFHEVENTGGVAFRRAVQNVAAKRGQGAVDTTIMQSFASPALDVTRYGMSGEDANEREPAKDHLCACTL